MRLDADHTAVYLSRRTVQDLLMRVRQGRLDDDRRSDFDADEAIGALLESIIADAGRFDAFVSSMLEPSTCPCSECHKARRIASARNLAAGSIG